MFRCLLEGVSIIPEILILDSMIVFILGMIWKLTGGKGIGAGDVKLLTVVATGISANALCSVFGVAFVSAGIFGIVRQKKTGIHLAFFIALGVLLHIGGLY